MEIVNTILLPVLATIITGLASWGVSALVGWLKTKINNENLQRALTTVGGIITATVNETSQTYVDELKKVGKFDAEAQKFAFNKTYEAIVNQLTVEQMDALKSVCNDVDAWLKSKIESTVAENK